MKRISHLSDLAQHFPAGIRVVIHSACAAPPRLSAQLLELAQVRGPFNLFDLFTVGMPGFVPGVTDGTLRLTTFVPGRAVRSALRAGKVNVVRRPLSQAPVCFADGDIGVDVLLLQVSVPDALGRMSLGISVDTIWAALARKPIVIAEVNPAMPRTHGNTAILPEDIDYWLEGGDMPQTVALAGGDAKDNAIADHVAGLICTGDVLQTGIGSIPDLTALRLAHLSELGIHTGIITEALQPLIEKGVITNASKPAFRGKSVATMAAGSPDFYRFLHDNPAIEFHPCDLTHSAATLAAIPQLCAINGALEIDLLGRVNAESADGQRVSAPGGQPDFAKGASAAPGGKSIIALRATSKDGSVSRIVPTLSPGTLPTIDSNAITHVVTEHGVAAVAGVSGSDLQRALSAVAAPEFRPDLLRA